MPVIQTVAPLPLDEEEKYNTLALLNGVRLVGTKFSTTQADKDAWRFLYAAAKNSHALQRLLVANFIQFFLNEVKPEMRHHDLPHYLEALPTLFLVNKRKLAFREVGNLCEDFAFRVFDLKARENRDRLNLLIETVHMESLVMPMFTSLINRCVAVRLKRQNITLFVTKVAKKKRKKFPWLEEPRQEFVKELYHFMIYGK